jgi:hypothetical protein
MDLQDTSKPSDNYARVDGKVDGASPEAGTRRTLSAPLQLPSMLRGCAVTCLLGCKTQ